MEFDPDSEALRILKLLRDDAHELANTATGLTAIWAITMRSPAFFRRSMRGDCQRLLVKFGSIRRITDARIRDLKEVLGDQGSIKAISDLEKYHLGKAAGMPVNRADTI